MHSNKSLKGGWNAAIFIIFVEMAERFAYYGLSGNLINYLTNVFKEPVVTAAQEINIWGGVSFVFPLAGAFIADSYLGRFITIVFASIIYLSGTILLTISASSVIPVKSRKLVLFIALYILSIGEGGHKPCIQTFAADQFEESSPQEIMDKSSFFNWWFLGIVIGALCAAVGVTYVQDNIGWDIGFGIVAAAMAIAFGIFLLGIKRYKKPGPLGSPFTTLAQVVVAAVRKRRVDEKHDGRGICYGDAADGSILVEPQSMTHPRTERIRYLDKAMIIDDIDASSNIRNPWRLCTLNQVEEIKLVFGLMPIWLACLYNSVIGSQMGTFFTKQGSTMDRSMGPHFNIPPASLSAIPSLATIIIIPIYDRLFVPLIRKFTGKPTGITILQRIGIGIFISIIDILVAAPIEAKRLKLARDHNLLDDSEAMLPIRVWWLLPQYILCGFADVFALIGLTQLFYDQMPESMRSVGGALYIGNFGVGSFVSSGIISIVETASKGRWLGNDLNSSRLDYYYYLLAGFGVLSLGLYVVVAKQYMYHQISKNYNL